MAHGFNDRVWCDTATTGTGNVTIGAAKPAHCTPAQAGTVNGDTRTWLLEEGNDFEIFRGAYTATGTVVTRGTVLLSQIAGTTGTTRMNLAGTATIREVAAAEDLLSIVSTSDAQDKLGASTIGKALFTAANKAAAQTAIATTPTFQFLTSSGTYNPTSADVKWIEVHMVGGGGGGGAAGSVTGTQPTGGGASAFNGVTAAGGFGGNNDNGGDNGRGGGAGGVGSGTTGVVYRRWGPPGAHGSYYFGGGGGPSYFGGAGQWGSNGAGPPGQANSGGGGAGASVFTPRAAGGGGGAGEHVYMILPAASYSYTIGAGGAAGFGSTNNGGAGGSGGILVIEHYGS